MALPTKLGSLISKKPTDKSPRPFCGINEVVVSLRTNLRGRLRNTSLSNSNGLMPLFEAVVNSIHSIEDRGIELHVSDIEIQVIRATHQQMRFNKNDQEKPPITDFIIKDNGIGFNDENMQSFCELDSEYKSSRGGFKSIAFSKAKTNSSSGHFALTQKMT